MVYSCVDVTERLPSATVDLDDSVICIKYVSLNLTFPPHLEYIGANQRNICC